MYRILSALACLIVLAELSVDRAAAQTNLYGIINELARQAQEAERRHQMEEQQNKNQQAIILEERRRQAEILAQQKLDQGRRDAEIRQEAERRAAEQVERDRQERARKLAQQNKAESDQLIPIAKQLIEDASEFVKTNPPRALDFVEQIAALNNALNGGDPTQLRNLMQALVSNLRQQSGYETFEHNRGEAKRAEANRYLTNLIKLAQQQRDFIRFYVTNNPTSKPTQKLLPLVKAIETALTAPELDGMKDLTTKTDVTIREAGLADEFIKSKDLLTNAPDPKAQQSLLRKTSKNSFLIEGDRGDFVIMFNSSSKSPHVAKNLRGEIEFDNDQARVCLYQSDFDQSQLFLLRQKLSKYSLKLVDIDKTDCNRTDLVAYDIIAVERSAFLKLKPDHSLLLLAAIENDQFRHLTTVTHEERMKAAQDDAKDRSQIKSDIEHGTKVGYGILIIDPKSSNLCLVARNSKAHKKWLDDHADRLATEMNLIAVTEKDDVDEAYKAKQRNECGAVYASAPELKKLMDALARDGTTYSVSVLWAAEADIENVARQIQKAEEEKEKDALSRRQRQEDERKLEAARRKEDAENRGNQQKLLQTQYGKIAASTAAAIANDVRTAFEARSDWQNTSGFQQFGNMVSAYQNLVRGRWELQTFNSDIWDYGTSEYKSRRLETSFAKVTVRMRNRILGEYKDLCLFFGRINDNEFSMPRDTIAATCDDSSSIAAWKSAHEFRSLWLAD